MILRKLRFSPRAVNKRLIETDSLIKEVRRPMSIGYIGLYAIRPKLDAYRYRPVAAVQWK